MGLLIVSTDDKYVTAEQLSSIQKSVVEMMKDDVVVIPRDFHITYIHTDDEKEERGDVEFKC